MGTTTNTNEFSLMALEALRVKTAGRKARAIELHASGKSLEAIAAELGTSTRSVRRYLPGVHWGGKTTK